MALDPKLATMFDALVMPQIKQMPTEVIVALKQHLDDKLDVVLAERAAQATIESP